MGLLSFLLGGGCEDVSPAEVKAMKDKGEKFVLLDVRTPAEHASRSIKGAKLIPLAELANRTGEIPADIEVVVYCANGFRSLVACRMLKKLGMRVKNMAGGISRW